MYYFYRFYLLVETNNLLKGTAIFRTEVDEYEELIFKKFCGADGGDQGKRFQVSDIIQTVGRFALEDGCKYVCIINANINNQNCSRFV